MKYKLHKLDNGLEVLITPIPSVKSATVTIWVYAGSRFETKRINGLSHFLEHIVFKGSKRRPTAKHISEAIDSIGAEINASTSKEWTNFYVKCRTELISTAFDVLSDMVLNPLLKQKDIDVEKGVIMEEIGMYEDTPMKKIGDVFEQLMYRGTALGLEISGTKDSVRGIARKDFEQYLAKYYFAHNMLITVAGGINTREVMKLSEKYFSDLKRSVNNKTKKIINSKLDKGPRVMLHSKKKEQAHLILGFLAGPMGHKDRFAEAILATVLGNGMSSRLFTEVREKRGLAYAIRSSVERYVDTGYLATYAGVDPKRVDDAVKVILKEHYSLSKDRKGQVTKEELEKAKEYLKGHLALSLEDTRSINIFYGIKQLILGKVETPDEVFKQIDKVTIGDVQRVARKLFTKKGLYLAVIGPYNDQNRFKKLLH